MTGALNKSQSHLRTVSRKCDSGSKISASRMLRPEPPRKMANVRIPSELLREKTVRASPAPSVADVSITAITVVEHSLLYESRQLTDNEVLENA